MPQQPPQVGGQPPQGQAAPPQGPIYGDLWFPIYGIDVSVALEQQTPDTTPMGVNVRGFEPTLNRARGGSRPGLSQFIPQTLPLGVPGSVIQMLQIVVDPDASAFDTSFPPVDLGFPPWPGSGFPPFGWPGAPPGSTPGHSGTNPVLVITADDEMKAGGTVFTWAGTEYKSKGLLAGDAINSVKFRSPGAAADAAPTSSSELGTYYPIYPYDADISLGAGHKPYIIAYLNGRLVVKKETLIIYASDEEKAQGTTFTWVRNC